MRLTPRTVRGRVTVLATVVVGLVLMVVGTIWIRRIIRPVF